MSENKSIQAGERTQHTPGPWEVEIPETSYDAIVTNDADWSIATVHGAGKKTKNLHATGVANARLIAAAPTMYQENKRLKEINTELLAAIRLLLTDELPADAYLAKISQGKRDIALAAIAKAEGRQ